MNASRFICAALLGASALAHAQSYPAKPITLIIPFPPGSGNDVVGRIVGGKLSEMLPQRVVPDNRAGASGNIAIEATKRAPADGYTVVVASTSFSINLHTAKVSYAPSDFTPVAMLGRLPFTLMVAKSVPAKNLKELVALAKGKPGQLNSATGTTGMGFFLTETLKKSAGVDIQAVPYKGTSAGVLDVLADRTHVMFAPMSTSLPHYKAGKVQVHGITGSKRSALMPEVSTFSEQGYPKLDIPPWFAILGPAGMPKAAVDTLSAAVAKTLASKDVADALTAQGVEPAYASPSQLDAFLRSDNAMWAQLVKELGIKPQ